MACFSYTLGATDLGGGVWRLQASWTTCAGGAGSVNTSGGGFFTAGPYCMQDPAGPTYVYGHNTAGGGAW